VSLNRIEVEGKPMIQAIVRDITKRKQIEETLRESEAQYHGIFDSATDSFLIFDIDGNIVDANPQACKMYGYPYGELIKLSGKDIVHHDYCHLFEQFKQDVQTTGEFHAESVDVHKDGTPFSIEVRGSAFNYNGKPHLLAVIRDITERKQSDDELKKKIDELERYKDVTVGRELRLIELKKKIKELEEK
jgi:PAS domain S-box-containing protein